MSSKYSIGIDFGTLSARAVLVEVAAGREIASAVKDYTHGVMDEFLPDGKTKLGPDWALQHPEDYLEALRAVIPAVIKEAGVNANDIIGLGFDFTSCTILPVDKTGRPLCLDEKFRSNPHSYVKLWKHHAAQKQANRLNEIAASRGEEFLSRYGSGISSEWMVPKVMQILDEAFEVYQAADRFVEAADWITEQLTGEKKSNSCAAGFKALWSKKYGYPSRDFYRQLDPRLENFVEEKLNKEVVTSGSRVGVLTEKAAGMLGLNPGTPVAAPFIDAHASLPGVGITEPGKMLMIIGTSTCHIVMDREEKMVPGISGVVEDGILAGLYAYEAGQACVGDHFEWFIENSLPAAYAKEAEEKGMNIHAYLRQKASKLKAGESGLLALDWWNGNRSVLNDADLTGLMLGYTLLTKPEEVYRALIEATAFGTRMIIEAYQDAGVPIRELYAAGGIAKKDEMMMQIYSDVTNREIRIAASAQTSALGSAVCGAVAAGKRNGGYDTIFQAARAMTGVEEGYYKPIPENVAAYDKLYAEYKRLHDYFGRSKNDVMKRLKKIREMAMKSGN
ncbi:MAG: ribulokinase [Caldicoprobacterales bacterium]|jgi:L-ribulokinase